MKTVWNAIAVVLLIDLLLVVGLVAYLQFSGRLSTERVEQVVEVFRPTLDQQHEAEMQEAAQAADQAQAAQQQQHLAAVAGGPITTQTQLSREQEEFEKQMLTVQRLREEVRALQRQLELSQRHLAQERAQINAERDAFESALAQENQRRQDVDFQHAVQLYEQLKPKQTKGMFADLVAGGQTDQVVDYLAAMQIRKAANVIKEFKDPQEIELATDLLQRLRNRGVDLGAAESEPQGTS